MKTVFNVHNLTYLKYKINLNEKKKTVLSHSLYSPLFLSALPGPGAVYGGAVSLNGRLSGVGLWFCLSISVLMKV